MKIKKIIKELSIIGYILSNMIIGRLGRVFVGIAATITLVPIIGTLAMITMLWGVWPFIQDAYYDVRNAYRKEEVK